MYIEFCNKKTYNVHICLKKKYIINANFKLAKLTTDLIFNDQ